MTMALRRLGLPATWPEVSVVTLGTFGLFAWSMPRLVTFEDAGMFDSVCYTNGIAHPPGYPLFTLLCAPLFRLPVAEPAIIGNSISAVFAALACGMLVAVLRRLDCDRLVAAFGGALLAVTASFWSQAIIVEVYALNAFLFLTVLYLCIHFYRSPGRWTAWLICLVYALGIANHWPLMVLAFPGLALICLARWDWIRTQLGAPGFWGMAMAMVLLGISPYATLLAKHHPLVSYSGPIHGPAGLWDYFMRKSYASVDRQAAANITDKWQYALWMGREVATQATPWALPLLLPALLAGHKRIGVPIQAGLALVFVANTWVLVLLLGFDYDYIFEAVFLPYPILAWCCLAIWLALGLQWLADRVRQFRRTGPALVGLLAITTVVLTFFANVPVNDRAGTTLADDYSRLVLDTVAKDAALVVSSDSQAFTLAYQHFVKGVRPDVTLYHINNLVFPDKLPGRTLRRRVAAVEAMAKRRPTYSIGVAELPLDTDYGIFTRHDLPGDPAVARDDRHAAFRRRLIDDYLAGRIRQPHERYFASELLLGFSNQLLALGNLEPLNAAEAADLARLEQTFSGTLATLYFALSHRRFDLSGERLLHMAFAMEDRIPAEASNQDRALFHYYFALLFLQGERGIGVDKNLARTLLLKSFDEWPVPRTPGLCLLLQLGPPAGHLSMTPRFEAHCQAPAGALPAPSTPPGARPRHVGGA